MRDYRPLETIRIFFTTNAADGSAIAPTGTPTAALYEDGSTTEITAGLTVTASYDGKTGFNLLEIVGGTAALKPGSTYVAKVDAVIAGLNCTQVVGVFSVLAQGGDIVSRGTLSAGGASAFTLPAGQRDRVKVGDAIRITGGTGYGYRPILAYNSTTGVGAVSAWDVNPVAGDYYEVVSLPNPEPLASTDFEDDFLTAAKIADAAIDAATFAAGAINAAALAADAITAAKVAADVTTEIQNGLALASALATAQAAITDLQSRIPAALVGGRINAALDSTGLNGSAVTAIQSGLAQQANVTDIQSRIPAALVGGRVSASVDNTGLADGAISASKLAADAITAAKVAADVTTEIQTGLATAAALAAVQADTDNIQTRLPAALVGGKMDAVATVDTTGLATSAAVAAVQADVDDIQARIPAALVGGRINAALDAAGLATGAIDADSIAADAVTKVQANLATAANQATIIGYVDTEVAQILAAVDTEIASILATTTKLETALELNLGAYRFTVAALANAPAGGGGGGITVDDIFAYAVENNLSFLGVCRILAAVFGGTTSGLEALTTIFKSADMDGAGNVLGTTNRVVATRELDADRTAVVLSLA